VTEPRSWPGPPSIDDRLAPGGPDQRRGRSLLALVGLLGIVAVALVTFILLGADPRPGDTAELRGGPWTITGIEGVPPEVPLTLTFDEHADFGQIQSACFTLRLEYTRDTDGDAFTFVEGSIDGAGCPEASRVRDALARVYGWRAPSAVSIEFWDDQGQTLIRAGRMSNFDVT
jgi:hypothetical protein